VADSANNKIRKITPAGVVTTLAGSGAHGSLDGTGAAATFYSPSGVAVDSSGNVYVADSANNKIRKITPAGVVTTLAGSGAQGSADGNGTAATFYSPSGVAVDSSGNVYVADVRNNRIRKIAVSGGTADRFVPFVGDVYGAGESHFTTELTLANLTSGPLSVTLVYTASLGSGSGQVTVSLAPGEQQIVPDITAFLRSRGLAIPNDGSNVGGSLLAQPPSGTSPSLFLVGARTFTPASSGGTFGVYYPGLTLAQSAPSVACVSGLQQNFSQRSNLAVVNRGDAFDSITLNVTYIDGTGTALGAPTAVTLAPGQWKQFDKPLQALGATSGYAVIQKTSGYSSFVAYGVLNDAVTSDGSYLPMAF
jgi:hypothetical protein